MIRSLFVFLLILSAATQSDARPRRWALYEDGSYSCSTDTSCNRAEHAQKQYYRQQGWECLTTFDFRGCLDFFR